MKKIFNLTMFFAVLIVLISRCHSKKQEQPEPALETGTLKLHIHTYVDGNEVEFRDTVYTMAGGRKISVDSAQLYISNIQLVKLDNSIYTVPDVIILQVRYDEEYSVAKVPAGNYKSIRFNVGLDPATNLKTPSSSSTDVLNTPAMWFESTAQPEGYVFLNFEGMIDTTAAANGTVAQMQPFIYKIGTNANFRKVIMPDENYTITPNQTQFIHLKADYAKLFNGILLNNNSNLSIETPSDNASVLAGTIIKNISAQDSTSVMFSYEY